MTDLNKAKVFYAISETAHLAHSGLYKLMIRMNKISLWGMDKNLEILFKNDPNCLNDPKIAEIYDNVCEIKTQLNNK